MIDDPLAKRLGELEELEGSLLDLAMKCMQAYGGAVYPMDLLANGASNRTLALCSGFRRMIADRNMICAGSLLRLQVDTALRFYAAYIVEDPHAFATEVLKGTRVDKLKDRDGKPMQDAHLVKRLAEAEALEWLPSVYRETSGYVHLSSKHLFNTFNSVDEATRTVQIKVGAADGDLPQDIYIEAVDAFIAATRLFMRYLHGWGLTKQNPEEVARMREAR
ncbi:MAG: hypothetical protein R3F49_15475 [Planctomycetota bacterium]